jgi:hypothetical protein
MITTCCHSSEGWNPEKWRGQHEEYDDIIGVVRFSVKTKKAYENILHGLEPDANYTVTNLDLPGKIT